MSAIAASACAAADTTALLEPPSGGPSDGGVITIPSNLDGWWMRPAIGNCIDFEDWLRFEEATSTFEHLVVDRNACGPHSIQRSILNQLENLGAGTIRRTWSDPTSVSTKSEDTVTTAPGGILPPGTLRPGYRAGDRVLAFLALVEEAPLRFTMTHDAVITIDESSSEVHDLARVKLDRLDADRAPHPCQMLVHLETTQREGMQPLIQGQADLSLPCTVRRDARGLTVSADGFETSSSDPWNELFTREGIWKQPGANELFTMFRPVLRLNHGLERALYMEGQTYREMLSDPPQRAD
ncbi:MAG: hypothetical protein U1E65_16120 [Myxococcota bacterium]